MKHTFVWLMTLVLAFPQITTAESTTMTKDEQNALSAVETMTQSFQDKDIDRVMAAYETPATVLFEPDTPISDAAVLEQMFRQMAMVNPVFVYSGHEVIVNNDIALHIAPWDMTGTTPDGQELKQSGLSIAVLRKQDDGSWKMMIDNPHGGRLLPQN